MLIDARAQKNYQNRPTFHRVIQKVARIFETRCIDSQNSMKFSDMCRLSASIN